MAYFQGSSTYKSYAQNIIAADKIEKQEKQEKKLRRLSLKEVHKSDITNLYSLNSF